MYKLMQFFFTATIFIILCSVKSYGCVFLTETEEEDTLTFYPRILSMSDSSSSEYAQNPLTDTATFLSVVNEQKNNSISDSSISDSFSGIASYYADRFQGRRTSCGEIYCHDSLTAAHRSLPFGTLLYVQNTSNGKAVIVRVNDRGPFKPGRCIDVSKRAAHELGIIGKGTGTIQAHIITPSFKKEQTEDENNQQTQSSSLYYDE